MELNGQPVGLKSRLEMKRGDRLRIRYPGGGGYGKPALRSREKVASDLRAGLISEAAAADIYGFESVKVPA